MWITLLHGNEALPRTFFIRGKTLECETVQRQISKGESHDNSGWTRNGFHLDFRIECRMDQKITRVGDPRRAGTGDQGNGLAPFKPLDQLWDDFSFIEIIQRSLRFAYSIVI